METARRRRENFLGVLPLR